MNNQPPYEIQPDDIDKSMLERNTAPTYDQLTCLIAERKAIAVHDPEVFDQSQVSQKKDLDAAALATMHKLNAPLLVYHQQIVDIFDRIWAHAMKHQKDRYVASLLHDHPGLDLKDLDLVARISRTVTSQSIMQQAMATTARFSAWFVTQRILHGLDPGVHSAVTNLPDVKQDGDLTVSLISIHGVENNLGDERLYVDLYRP